MPGYDKTGKVALRWAARLIARHCEAIHKTNQGCPACPLHDSERGCLAQIAGRSSTPRLWKINEKLSGGGKMT